MTRLMVFLQALILVVLLAPLEDVSGGCLGLFGRVFHQRRTPCPPIYRPTPCPPSYYRPPACEPKNIDICLEGLVIAVVDSDLAGNEFCVMARYDACICPSEDCTYDTDVCDHETLGCGNPGSCISIPELLRVKKKHHTKPGAKPKGKGKGVSFKGDASKWDIDQAVHLRFMVGGEERYAHAMFATKKSDPSIGGGFGGEAKSAGTQEATEVFVDPGNKHIVRVTYGEKRFTIYLDKPAP